MTMAPQEEMPMNDMPEGDGALNSEMPINDSGSEFDTNFDAGVEADEDEDPKKYIQQLTGKLSQELGKYNNELGEPDTELSKYVGGMIVKQVAKGLGEDDKKDLIKKIKMTDSETEEPIDNDGLDSNMEDNPEMKQQMESYTLHKKDLSKLYENLIDLEKKDNDNLDIKKEIKTKKNSKPFIAPKFN